MKIHLILLNIFKTFNSVTLHLKHSCNHNKMPGVLITVTWKTSVYRLSKSEGEEKTKTPSAWENRSLHSLQALLECSTVIGLCTWPWQNQFDWNVPNIQTVFILWDSCNTNKSMAFRLYCDSWNFGAGQDGLCYEVLSSYAFCFTGQNSVTSYSSTIWYWKVSACESEILA